MAASRTFRWCYFAALVIFGAECAYAEDWVSSFGGMTTVIYGVAAGVAALFIALHAIRWKTAGGAPERNAARKSIINVIIGLLMIMMAAVTVHLLYYPPDAGPQPPPRTYTLNFVTTRPPVTYTPPTTRIPVTATSTAPTTTVSAKTACEEYKATGTLPAKFDLRNVNGVNYMTPVKAQQCGDCWAFATVGTLEGTYNFEQGKPSNIDLSEQDLISCTFGIGNNGCDGGEPLLTLNYLKSSTLCDESCFGYAGANLACSDRCSWDKNGWKTTSVEEPSNDQAVKVRLICGGPIAVASGGWNHAIALAGYDDDSDICSENYGTPGCWIIKNDFGVFTGTAMGVYHQAGYGYIPYSGHEYSDFIPGYWGIGAPTGIVAP